MDYFGRGPHLMSGIQQVLVGGSYAAALKTVNAVDFDGTNDYMTRGAGLTGAADSSRGIFSCWLRLDGGDGADMMLFADAAVNCYLRRHDTNKFDCALTDPTGAKTVTIASVASHVASATWKNILMSWDVNFSDGNKLIHQYINDVSDKSVTDGVAAFSVDYTATNWGIGAYTSGTQKLNGCLAEVYLAFGQYLDFSVTANRRKFLSATIKPVQLGSDGSAPTGVAPIVYLQGNAAGFGTNSGSGGNFTITGTLDTASTSPSD